VSLRVILNNPGAARELSAARMVNVTGKPLLVPDPIRVTVCATSSKVAEATFVA